MAGLNLMSIPCLLLLLLNFMNENGRMKEGTGGGGKELETAGKGKILR